MENMLKITFIFTIFLLAASTDIVYLNPGCRKFDTDGICLSCSTRFYKDPKSICQPVSPSCNGYNPENGNCTTCYSGFALIEGACLPEFLISSSFDPYCNKF